MFNFSEALKLLKQGMRVQRTGWNGKGMFIYLVPPASYPAQRGPAKAWAGENAMIPYQAYIAMKTVDETVVPWLASQTDLMAEDWDVIPEYKSETEDRPLPSELDPTDGA